MSASQLPNKPKVFIASSTRAKLLAEALKTKLEEEAEVGFWPDIFKKSAGKVTIEILVDQCRQSDFAAVLLTRDDLSKKGGLKTQSPRDNCIFELGLFTGALGLDPERAFIITSVELEALPSDLRGVSYIAINEPSTWSKPSCAKSISDAADTIKKAMKERGFCHYRPDLKIMSTQHLMRLERPGNPNDPIGGNLNKFGEVLVYSSRPVEQDYECANRVQLNMKAKVKYKYFFQADRESIDLISNLIQTLAVAGLNVQDPETFSQTDWEGEMTKNPEVVRKNLGNMKDYLRIYFLSNKAAIPFCIHNATDDDHAKCYLRYSSDKFVEWYFRGEAKDVADDLKKRTSCDDQENESEKFIFCATRGYKLYADPEIDADGKIAGFRKLLHKRILEMFPETLRPDAKEACFGNKIQ